MSRKTCALALTVLIVALIFVPGVQAEFEVSNLQIGPTEAEVWEEIVINFTVTNVGEESGSYTLWLAIDGPPSDLGVGWMVNWTGTLGPGELEICSYRKGFERPGEYVVHIDRLEAKFTVKVPLRPAEFTFSNLGVSYRTEEGQSTTICVDVINVGEEIGSCTVELKINREVVDAVEIRPIEPGVTLTQYFTVTREEGTYEVEVEGLTGSFTVIVPEPPGPPFWVNVGFVLLVIAGVAVILRYAWRKGGRYKVLGLLGSETKEGEDESKDGS